LERFFRYGTTTLKEMEEMVVKLGKELGVKV
jgi:hypothetical protein